MFLPVLEYVHISSDEGVAVVILSSLIETRPEFAPKIERVVTRLGSARAVLEALVENGTIGRVSDDEARCYDEEIRRHETEEQERASIGVRDGD